MRIRLMRIKLEYIEVMMLIEGLSALHIRSKIHDDVKRKLTRRLIRMQQDYTGGYADNKVVAKISKAIDGLDAT